jgi:hypothetical protein
MPTHGHGHRRHVGGLIVILPAGDANGRPAMRAAGGAAAPLPLLGALRRLRCGSACPRQPGSCMKGVCLVGELVTPRSQSRGRKLPSGRRHREPRGRLRWECRSTTTLTGSHPTPLPTRILPLPVLGQSSLIRLERVPQTTERRWADDSGSAGWSSRSCSSALPCWPRGGCADARASRW